MAYTMLATMGQGGLQEGDTTLAWVESGEVQVALGNAETGGDGGKVKV